MSDKRKDFNSKFSESAKNAIDFNDSTRRRNHKLFGPDRIVSNKELTDLCHLLEYNRVGINIYVSDLIEFPKKYYKEVEGENILVRGQRHFIPKKQIKGIVIIGNGYPLSGCDLTIDEHFEFHRHLKAIRSKSQGDVLDIGAVENGEHLSYFNIDGSQEGDNHGTPLY